jgi:hypothetical protein
MEDWALIRRLAAEGVPKASHGLLLHGADRLLIKRAGWGQAGTDAPADESGWGTDTDLVSDSQ